MPSCVLAYSGGLDTSVHSRLAQGSKATKFTPPTLTSVSPAKTNRRSSKRPKTAAQTSARIVDAREELCRDFAFPVLQWQAKYETSYLLGTSIARPLIAKACLQVAREVGAKVFAHGATGKGNDQCRFQLAAEALEPGITGLAPWRIE